MSEKKGARRLARERAFRGLYGLAYAESDGVADPAAALADQPKPEGEPKLSGKGKEFLRQLVLGAWSRREELDETIGRFSQNWKVGRMAWVDLAILRLGMFELLCRPDIPPRVVINEAVELAKAYGDHNTPGFVNGILDAAARALERGEMTATLVEIAPEEGEENAAGGERQGPIPAAPASGREAAVKQLMQALSRLEHREHSAAHRVSMGVLAVLGDPWAKYYLQQEGFGVPAGLSKLQLANALRLTESAVGAQLCAGRSSLNAALSAAGSSLQLKLSRDGALLQDGSGKEWLL